MLKTIFKFINRALKEIPFKIIKMVAKPRVIIASLAILFCLLLGLITSYYVISDLYKLKMTVLISHGNYLGSGVRISPNYLITNKHVVGDSKEVTVTNYKNEKQHGTVVLTHPFLDVAVVKVDEYNPYYARLFCHSPLFGQNVTAVGRSEFINIGLTPLRVSSNWFHIMNPQADLITQLKAGPNRLLLTGKITFGSSGSGVYLFDNSVVGLATMIMGSANSPETLNFAVAVAMEDTCGWLSDNNIPYYNSYLPDLAGLMKSLDFSNGFTNKQELANNMTNLLNN